MINLLHKILTAKEHSPILDEKADRVISTAVRADIIVRTGTNTYEFVHESMPLLMKLSPVTLNLRDSQIFVIIYGIMETEEPENYPPSAVAWSSYTMEDSASFLALLSNKNIREILLEIYGEEGISDSECVENIGKTMDFVTAVENYKSK